MTEINNITEEVQSMEIKDMTKDIAVKNGSGQDFSALPVTAEDVLKALYEPDETICLRVFDDKKGGTFSGQKYSCRCSDYTQIEPELKKHNEVNHGVFYVVNHGGDVDKEINRINAQFVEMDEGSFEEQMAKVKTFPLAPSMIIKTRKSLHIYWFMDKSAKVERFREIQKKLVKHFDGDSACVNESRVMRLPGFNHCKTDTPVMVTCICFHSERKYTQDQLCNVLPELPEGENTPIMSYRQGKEKGIDAVMHSCLFMRHCKDNAETLSEPLWHAMIANLARFEGGGDKIHELSKPYPEYTEAETQQKISHFLESGVGPMTCQTICERGFVCPKFANGGCGVKSPAALCCKPLKPEILIEILAEQPVANDCLKDVQTATKFVQNYLNNQEAAISEVMINENIREHFALKRNYTRALVQTYKEANKDYKANKQTKRALFDKPLPQWYEFVTGIGMRFLPGVLAQNLYEKEPVIYAAQQYYRYDKGVYKPWTDLEARGLVKSKMIPEECRSVQISDAENQWRLLALCDTKKINPDPYIINLKNGLYDVKKDILKRHTKDYLSTIQLQVNYNQEADCPLFKKFLSEAMDGDMDQVKLIQEILGYCLIPVNLAQKCFVFTGAAAAGKSVLLNVLNDILLGRKHVSNVSWQALNERFKSAELFGKLANIFADLPTKNIDDNGIFKALVGEDCITAERKNKDPFSFQSTARLLFSCNSIPKNYGDKSEGFYRRLIIIRFNRTIPQEERDTHLLDKLREESDGIFMFALAGLKRLITNDYKFSETQANIDALQQYREDSDSMLSFVKDCCERSESYASGSTELYLAYKSYCDESGMKPYSQKTFVQQLQAAGIGESKKIAGTRSICGVRVNKSAMY